MTVKGKYGGRKVRDGTVVSDKMDKTLLVAVEEHIRHPLYKKRVRRLRRFMAHDEREEGKMGDRVRIVEAAPISRKKRWNLVEILERAELPDVAPESIDLDLLGEVKRSDAEAAETVGAPVTVAQPEATEPESAEEPAPESVAEEAAVEEAATDAPADEPSTFEEEPAAEVVAEETAADEVVAEEIAADEAVAEEVAPDETAEESTDAEPGAESGDEPEAEEAKE